jgi:hypothetical protein
MIREGQSLRLERLQHRLGRRSLEVSDTIELVFERKLSTLGTKREKEEEGEEERRREVRRREWKERRESSDREKETTKKHRRTDLVGDSGDDISPFICRALTEIKEVLAEFDLRRQADTVEGDVQRLLALDRFNLGDRLIDALQDLLLHLKRGKRRRGKRDENKLEKKNNEKDDSQTDRQRGKEQRKKRNKREERQTNPIGQGSRSRLENELELQLCSGLQSAFGRDDDDLGVFIVFVSLIRFEIKQRRRSCVTAVVVCRRGERIVGGFVAARLVVRGRRGRGRRASDGGG